MTWPKRVTRYLSGETDEYSGLWDPPWSEPDAYHYSLYELRVDLEVYEDGTYKILSIRDGKTILVPKEETG